MGVVLSSVPTPDFVCLSTASTFRDGLVHSFSRRLWFEAFLLAYVLQFFRVFGCLFAVRLMCGVGGVHCGGKWALSPWPRPAPCIDACVFDLMDCSA